MKFNPNATLFKRGLAWLLSATIVFPGPASAALTDISSEPLAQPASSVKPNIMLILDDSGSMEDQYTPDYLGRRFGGSNALCFDAGDDSSGTITGGLDNCQAGDVPLMSPDINTQYYNPEIRYFPPVNFDGTSKNSMTAANTTNWTVVPTDAVSPAGVNDYRRDTYNMVENSTGSTVNNVNLATGYPDRVWCTNVADSATDTTLCKVNSAYSYPDVAFSYGLTSGGNIKYRTGAPYYYRLAATEHCTDQNMTNCAALASPTVTYPVPAPVRFCTNNTLSSCQAKRLGSFTYPKFTGNVNPGSAAQPGQVSIANLTVNTQKDTAAASVTAILVNGVNILSSTLNIGASFSANTAADSIRNAINANTATSGYHATRNNNLITVRFGPSSTAAPAPSGSGNPSSTTGTPSAAPNGNTLQMQFAAPTYTAPRFTVDVDGATSGASNGVTSLRVSGSGTELLMASVLCPSNAVCGSTSSNRRTYVATQLTAMINTSGLGANLGHGFTASRSGTTVTVFAPASFGSSLNGTTPSESSPSVTLTLGNWSNGVTTNDVDMTISATFGAGQDSTAAAVAFRENVGLFSRIDIKPFQDAGNTIPSTFTKYPARQDCVASECSYAEEMTNFANWYSYYRTRMAMAKTAIGRAFVGITDAFRVGFITINPGGDIANRFKAAAEFTSGAGNTKDLWYQWLYKQGSHGSTPLREALSRVGRYFGGVTTGINAGMGASPIQVACQPNFAILTTDGYWNGNAGIKLDGTAIGNQDNVDSGFSKRSEARYDGGGSSRTDTLSDVAMYYYKTDLRSDLADQVPVTGTDPASHQHMTLFTVGLGLAGQLTFDKAYQSGTSPDFERLKVDPASGGLNWPTPAADSETALDDLWHAAVNGRGTFFSAKDPSELSSAIAETLSAVNARVGAGAAAATSNLQPVAGDNFAFTAQYETVQWIGDIKARTIDLSTGTVATRELWAAAALLDARGHNTRNIYTFDATDVTGTGDNFNKLKSFCYAAAIGQPGYPTCTDGTGLTAAELDFFNPMVTSAAPSNQPPLTQSAVITSNGAAAEATAERLVDYLRGDAINETTGGTGPGDLFRNRTSILGDIINAQPAYVKASPFSYNTGNFAGRDPYYQEYRSSTNGITGTRKGTVYVAANDGMLHALETDPDNNPYFQTAGIATAITSDDTFAGTLSTSPTGGEGAERWAYVPNLVMKDMKRLADSPYSHRFYTDGSPTVGDICLGHTTAVPCSAQANWRTILVAGLNAGGRGYYALDVTDPDNPKGLWEVKGGTGATCLTDVQANGGTFSEDCNIGLTFGNPLIVKRKSDGKWVVIFTSGLNNLLPGDGKGYLYIVDAQTGKILKRYTTGVGCDGVSVVLPCTAGTNDPSGFGRINAWVDNASLENMALTVYGADLKGNVWRIQLDNTVTDVPVDTVTRIATLTAPDGTPQAVTTKPELGEVDGKRVVFIGTGKFLGSSDKASIQRQSIYAIKDAMASVVSPTVAMTRGGAFPASTITGFVRQDLSASGTSPATERVSTTNVVDFTSPTVNGWFIDLPDGGSGGSGTERVNVDPILQLGTLVTASNVPSTDTCVAGGFGWINFLNAESGGFVPGSSGNMASTKIAASLVVGINVVQLPGGTVKTIVTTADNQQLTKDTPVAPSTLQGRRVSWRELFFE